MVTSAKMIYSPCAAAFETASQTSLPDEAFLEFLANSSQVDGEVTDALDMLELADEPLLNQSETSNVDKESSLEIPETSNQKINPKIEMNSTKLQEDNR